MRTNSAGQAGSGGLRTSLVVLQFAVSIGLGIAALVVFSQINYARDMDLGFSHDNVVVISSASRLTPERRKAMSQALRADPGITASACPATCRLTRARQHRDGPGSGRARSITLLYERDRSRTIPRSIGMKLLAGRLLSETRGDDRDRQHGADGMPLNEGRNILINAAARARLGLTPQEAVGQDHSSSNHTHVQHRRRDGRYQVRGRARADRADHLSL